VGSCLHALGAVLFSQSHDGLGLSEVAHGMIREDLADHSLGLGSHLSRPFAAVAGCGHEIGQLLGRVIRGIGDPRTGTVSPQMSFDQLGIEEDSNEPVTSSHPDLAPDEAGRQRVIGLIEQLEAVAEKICQICEHNWLIIE